MQLVGLLGGLTSANMFVPIPPHLPKRDTHAYAEDFLSSEDLEFLLNLPEWGEVTNGKIQTTFTQGQEDSNIRRTKIAWFYNTEQNKYIWDKLTPVIAEINAKFFEFDLSGIYEPAQLGLYLAEDNATYDWHVDTYPRDSGISRKIAMVLLLNDTDEFDGGELHIKNVSNDSIKLELKKGRAWFFPAYTLHTVTPVIRGVRKSLVVWASGPAFR